MPSFDLAIIGAGPGGFDAALRGRELGFKVALIEKSDAGGTCLNTGCIPAKALLASTKFLTKMREASSFGISVSEVRPDFSAMMERKTRIVETLKKGMLETLRRAGVEWIEGEATFVGKNRLRIIRRGAVAAPGRGTPAPTDEIESKFILIATGAEPAPFPGVPFDGERILSSTHLLEAKRVPERLVLIGGGVIGVEFASIFSALGSKITIVEMLERLIPNEDEEISRRLESIFRRQGMEIYTATKVKEIGKGADAVEIVLESGTRIKADQILIATGRRPHIGGLNLEKAGVKTEKGAIVVGEYLETPASGVFAIGDVTNRSTGLAHGASAEGIRVVSNLKGPKKKMDYTAIPNCIYTDPEVASVGVARSVSPKSKEETVECKILFASLGKSHIEGEPEGFVKMIAAKRDGRILGVAGIGGKVTELIHEATLAVKAGVTVHTLAETVHAHPTEGEILQKAAEKLCQSS